MTTSSLADTLRGAFAGSLLSLRVDTEPNPSCRPRVGKFGTYYATAYQRCYADCQKQLAVQKPAEPMQGDLAAVVEVIIQRPKKTVLVRPKGDVDNYCKAPLDAATKAGVWNDDGQVTVLAALKRWTDPGELPGINLMVATI